VNSPINGLDRSKLPLFPCETSLECSGIDGYFTVVTATLKINVVSEVKEIKKQTSMLKLE
jgi:hypothetical protein